ncbi:hypothetical protein L6164_002103 [Bauhinia variegata]|uniref:Uncharacterized protein n=1 Tax=Bauhinia variegata TaxID=167791 RepID=A0ACB9PZA0_BAUVA|nr:hypothetical protein L6164_002103 [Bauhinia variegata]
MKTRSFILQEPYRDLDVVEIKRIRDKILSVRLPVARETINDISAHAPQVGSETHLKWKDLEGLVKGLPQEEKILIKWDLNDHVGI